MLELFLFAKVWTVQLTLGTASAQVLIWKTFFIENIYSQSLAEIILQASAIIFEYIIQIAAL